MKALGILGSPRKDGNTAFLLQKTFEVLKKKLKTEIIFLGDYDIKACIGCRSCEETEECIIQDDMQRLYKKLNENDVIILASPSYFGSVTAQMKAFMDRTWPLRKGKLKNKIGGSVVVGRRFIENTLTNSNAFFLRHEMILGHRGVLGFALEKGDISNDKGAIKDARKLGERILELIKIC